MRRIPLLLSALLFSALSHATSIANVSTVSCSGSQSFDLSSAANLSCDGDFSLIGGSIDSSSGITISAMGSLFIGNLKLSAPFIRLNTQSGTLSFGDGVSMTADSIMAGIGNSAPFEITQRPGANLSQPGRDATIVAQKPDAILLTAPGNIDLTRDTIKVFPQPRSEPSLSLVGRIEINAGAGIVQFTTHTLPPVSTVPEPDKFWSMLSGGLLLLAIGRIRGRI